MVPPQCIQCLPTAHCKGIQSRSQGGGMYIYIHIYIYICMYIYIYIVMYIHTYHRNMSPSQGSRATAPRLRSRPVTASSHLKPNKDTAELYRWLSKNMVLVYIYIYIHRYRYWYTYSPILLCGPKIVNKVTYLYTEPVYYYLNARWTMYNNIKHQTSWYKHEPLLVKLDLEISNFSAQEWACWPLAPTVKSLKRPKITLGLEWQKLWKANGVPLG